MRLTLDSSQKMQGRNTEKIVYKILHYPYHHNRE